MSLKVKTETVNIVDVNDLEQFISKTTGHYYEAVPNEEWNNDSQHRYEINGKMSERIQKDWEEFKTTGEQYQFRLRTILNGLCVEGHLAPGVYLINVSW